MAADRHSAFVREFELRGLRPLVQLLEPRDASVAELELFHTPEHVRFVQERSQSGSSGWLDGGDTPAFRGVFEAAACVVGSSLRATEWIMGAPRRRAFVPIAGLHHATRERAAGFCVFNDCGVVIEHLRRAHGIQRIAYVDIDAHHGDGVYYAFEADPELIFADLHQSGESLYPGTGAAHETGRDAALGTKLNVPLPAGAGDVQFAEQWPRLLAHVAQFEPQRAPESDRPPRRLEHDNPAREQKQSHHDLHRSDRRRAREKGRDGPVIERLARRVPGPVDQNEGEHDSTDEAEGVEVLMFHGAPVNFPLPQLPRPRDFQS